MSTTPVVDPGWFQWIVGGAFTLMLTVVGFVLHRIDRVEDNVQSAKTEAVSISDRVRNELLALDAKTTLSTEARHKENLARLVSIVDEMKEWRQEARARATDQAAKLDRMAEQLAAKPDRTEVRSDIEAASRRGLP